MDIVYSLLIRVSGVCRLMVLTCAVSPAQKSPFGLLHKVRRTEERKWFNYLQRREPYGHTKCIYEEVILDLINIPVL